MADVVDTELEEAHKEEAVLEKEAVVLVATKETPVATKETQADVLDKVVEVQAVAREETQAKEILHGKVLEGRKRTQIGRDHSIKFYSTTF